MWVCTGEREEKGGRKYRHERECGESKHERESSTEVRSVRCAVDLDLKLYSPHSLSQCLHFCSYSWTPLSPPAIPSTTRNPSLQHSSPLPPSLAPSIPGGAAAWVAGGGRRRDLGAPSQEANRCSPSGVSQMADIKKSWGGGRERWKHPSGWAGHRVLHISLPLFECALPGFFLFSSFLLEVSTSSAPTFEDSGSLSDTSAASTQGLSWLRSVLKLQQGGNITAKQRFSTDATHSYISQTHTSVKYKFSTSESLYCPHTIAHVHYTTPPTPTHTNSHTHMHAPVPVP